MDNVEFDLLKIKASVCPSAETWPEGDVQVSIMGDRPTIKGELHWSALHGAVAELRDRTLKTLGALSGIEDNKKLSLAGRLEEKQKTAKAAIADLEKSPALARARAAVEQQVKRWDKELAPPPVDPTVAAEIRGHVARLRDGDRLPFVTKNIAEAAPAILQGPAFLSGLTSAEIEIVRRHYEASRNPSAADGKSKAMDALAHCEQGRRAAIRMISDLASLGKTHNGGGMAA